ncbi:hypothetical protein DPMN_017930 [Dreissena polymorpha]|uniref:Uncharacterized protein n=1 Tax=Dreissena polymorpha TaxID=45954 RepID=A0A9D4NHU5_DREPO|nr:hypothetical protein DPMN_017930 [Dreissena polymorpha]
MERSGCMENTNDVHNNNNLADRFDGKVKDLWLDLCDLISHYFPNFSEQDRLKILSYITQVSASPLFGICICKKTCDELFIAAIIIVALAT